MRECFLVLLFICVLVNVSSTPPTPSLNPHNNIKQTRLYDTETLSKFLFLSIVINFLNLYIFSLVSESFHSVPYNFPLNFVSYKQRVSSHSDIPFHLFPFLSVLLLDLHEFIDLLPSILHLIDWAYFPSLNIYQAAASIKTGSFSIISIVLMASSYSHHTHILCIFVLTLSFTHHAKKPTTWYLTLILLLSHDIEKNP